MSKHQQGQASSEENNVEPAETGQEEGDSIVNNNNKKRDLEDVDDVGEPSKKKVKFFELENEPFSYELDKTMAEYANRQTDIFQTNN